MRTLLLYPSFEEEFGKYPPLGIAYLAGVLRDRGFPVDIIDAARYHGFSDFENELREKHPSVLGISVLSVHFEKAVKAAEIAKNVLPDVTVVFGGAHPTAMPEDTLANDNVDVIVLGEGEYKLARLLTALEKDEGLDTVKGICYRSNGRVVRTADADFIENLDELPYPARDLLQMEEYLRRAPTMPLPYPSTTIMPTRGCFGNCRFCQPSLRRLFGRGIRYRSAQNVVDEMLHLKETYRVRGLFFADDEPTWVKEWMMGLCEEISSRGVGIAWTCTGRVDSADREMLTAMKHAGCIAISFGVESGSRKILKYYRKGISVEQIANAFTLCQEVGIIARANLMIGAPDETEEDVNDTVRMVEQIKPDFIVTSVTTPTVGTDLYDDALERSLLRREEYGEYDRRNIDTMHRKLSDRDIQRLVKRVVGVYRKQIVRTLLNPFALYRKWHLFRWIALHWLTMIKAPSVLARDLIYYFNYANKERISRSDGKDKREQGAERG